MNAQHTPGPWEPLRYGQIRDGYPKWLTIWNESRSKQIATVGNEDRNDEQEANARLIAAAPDMLELLTELHEHGDTTTWNHDRVRAVIAKATGAD